MIGPIDAFVSVHAMSAERAATLVVRGLEKHPVAVNTFLGTVGAAFSSLAPRLSDVFSHAMAQRSPDSEAESSSIGPREG